MHVFHWSQADVYAKTEDGTTPLYVACRKGHEEVAKLLLHHGSDVLAKRRNGSTALFAAVEAGLPQVGASP